jgi:hypothetical protein
VQREDRGRVGTGGWRLGSHELARARSLVGVPDVTDVSDEQTVVGEQCVGKLTSGPIDTSRDVIELAVEHQRHERLRPGRSARHVECMVVTRGDRCRRRLCVGARRDRHGDHDERGKQDSKEATHGLLDCAQRGRRRTEVDRPVWSPTDRARYT